MANVKITDLTAATALGGTELFETVQSGSSVKASATQIKTFVGDSLNITGGTIGSSTLSNVRLSSAVGSLASVTISAGAMGSLTVTGGTFNSVTLSNAVGEFDSITVTAGAVPITAITGINYAQLSSTRDQTAASANVAYAVSFDTASSWNTGITTASSTNITFAADGVYLCSMNFQLKNTDASNHTVTVWYQKNGTNVANTGSTISVPKAADGGVTVFELTFQEQVTAGQYLTLYWAANNTALSLDYTAASAGPPNVPAIPSVIFTSNRIF
jgi:hypothetical protein